MIYLERSAEIIAEIRSQTLVRGKVVGRSSKTDTTSVGSYDSVMTGASLHLAVKETFGSHITPEEGVIRGLAFAGLIYDNIPVLRSELPLIIGLATEETGKQIGQLTEDFTKGGSFRIWEVFKERIIHMGAGSEDLRRLIGGEHRGLPYLLNDEELAHMFFEVEADRFENQRRIGDFDTAWMHMSLFGDPHLDLLRQIQGEIDRYTLSCNLKSRLTDS